MGAFYREKEVAHYQLPVEFSQSEVAKGLRGIGLFKAVNPVRLQKINEENDGAQAPGQRVGPENDIDHRDKVQNDSDVAYPENTPEAEHGEHWHGGFPGASQNACNAVGEGQKKIKEGGGPGVDGSVGDHLRRAVESGNQEGDGNIDKDSHQLRHDDGTDDAETRALFCPLIFLGTEVLADKGGERHGEAGDGKEAKALYFGVGAASGDSHFPEFIDIGLYHHIGQGDDGVLEPGRQAV